MNASNVINDALIKCSACPGNCNKRGIVGSGSTLYIIPYESDDDEILSHRGTVIREVACENGVDFICNVYVRSLMLLYENIVCTVDYASKLVGCKVESFEKFRWRGHTILATNTPCDIRVRQELGEV